MVFDASSYAALQLRQLLHGGGASSGEERPVICLFNNFSPEIQNLESSN